MTVIVALAAAMLSLVWAGGASAATGTLQICKSGANGASGVAFSFTATNVVSGATKNFGVTGGSCSNQMNAGTGKWQLQEDLSSGKWSVTSIAVAPPAAAVAHSLNLAGGSIVVKVTAGAATQVTYTDAQPSSTFEVCKWSNTASIVGKTFTFSIGNFGTVTAVAGDSPDDAGCSTPIPIQTGAKIAVQESVPVGDQVSSITAGGRAVITSQGASTAWITIGNGDNSVYFENEPGPASGAYGTVEICKQMIPGEETYNNVTVFQFSINGGPSFGVAAGHCSGPMLVPSGNATVTETVPTNFAFVSATATGPLGESRLVSGGNPATVAVVYPGGSGNETLVTFTDKVQTSLLKICKLIDPGALSALGGLSYSFTWTIVANGVTTTGTASVTPPYNTPAGSCSGIIGGAGIPVVNPDGSRAVITVTENGQGGIFRVDGLDLENVADLVGVNFGTATFAFNPAPGISTITLTNTST